MNINDHKETEITMAQADAIIAAVEAENKREDERLDNGQSRYNDLHACVVEDEDDGWGSNGSCGREEATHLYISCESWYNHTRKDNNESAREIIESILDAAGVTVEYWEWYDGGSCDQALQIRLK